MAAMGKIPNMTRYKMTVTSCHYVFLYASFLLRKRGYCTHITLILY